MRKSMPDRVRLGSVSSIVKQNESAGKVPTGPTGKMPVLRLRFRAEQIRNCYGLARLRQLIHEMLETLGEQIVA